jgi:hypothetical protein
MYFIEDIGREAKIIEAESQVFYDVRRHSVHQNHTDFLSNNLTNFIINNNNVKIYILIPKITVRRYKWRLKIRHSQ